MKGGKPFGSHQIQKEGQSNEFRGDGSVPRRRELPLKPVWTKYLHSNPRGVSVALLSSESPTGQPGTTPRASLSPACLAPSSAGAPLWITVLPSIFCVAQLSPACHQCETVGDYSAVILKPCAWPCCPISLVLFGRKEEEEKLTSIDLSKSLCQVASSR